MEEKSLIVSGELVKAFPVVAAGLIKLEQIHSSIK